MIGRAMAFAFLVVAAIGAAAQTTDRVVRLGFVYPNIQSSSIDSGEAFWGRLHDLAARYRIPAMYALLEFTREGGLIAYSTDQAVTSAHG